MYISFFGWALFSSYQYIIYDGMPRRVLLGNSMKNIPTWWLKLYRKRLIEMSERSRGRLIKVVTCSMFFRTSSEFYCMMCTLVPNGWPLFSQNQFRMEQLRWLSLRYSLRNIPPRKDWPKWPREVAAFSIPSEYGLSSSRTHLLTRIGRRLIELTEKSSSIFLSDWKGFVFLLYVIF